MIRFPRASPGRKNKVLQSFFRVCSWAFDHLYGLNLDALQLSTNFFGVAGSRTGQYSRCGLKCTKQGGMIEFLSLLAMCLWMQPRICFVLLAAMVHCLVQFSLMSIQTPSWALFLTGTQVWACTGLCGYVISGAAPCICLDDEFCSIYMFYLPSLVPLLYSSKKKEHYSFVFLCNWLSLT